jgi:hypothetical protein
MWLSQVRRIFETPETSLTFTTYVCVMHFITTWKKRTSNWVKKITTVPTVNSLKKMSIITLSTKLLFFCQENHLNQEDLNPDSLISMFIF